MSEVTLSIAGNSYSVACAPGQESHIRTLGGMIEEKLKGMGKLSPQAAQNLLFAALFLADDLFEANRAKGDSGVDNSKAEERIQELELDRKVLTDQIADLERRLADKTATSTSAASAPDLEELARTLENYADKLEQQVKAA